MEFPTFWWKSKIEEELKKKLISVESTNQELLSKLTDAEEKITELEMKIKNIEKKVGSSV